MNASRRVAVVGGGPAGCAAALTLARTGLDVTLFERGGRARQKPCGDAFMPSAVRLLRMLGLGEGDFEAAGGSPFSRVTLRGDREVIWRAGLSDGTGWMLPRAAIDQILRDRVSNAAAVLHGCNITRLTPLPQGGAELTVSGGHGVETFAAVVLATGSGCRAAEALGINGLPIVAASVTAHVAGAYSDSLEFRFSERYRPGYAWVFPYGTDGTNLGVCALGRGNMRTLAQTARELVKPLCGMLPRLRGGRGDLWSGQGSCWHHGAGILSCGDAAGLVDPLSGEGLTAALRSGMEAGQAIQDWIDRAQDPAVLPSYDEWVKGHFEREYARTGPRRSLAMLCGVS